MKIIQNSPPSYSSSGQPEEIQQALQSPRQRHNMVFKHIPGTNGQKQISKGHHITRDLTPKPSK